LHLKKFILFPAVNFNFFFFLSNPYHVTIASLATTNHCKHGSVSLNLARKRGFSVLFFSHFSFFSHFFLYFSYSHKSNRFTESRISTYCTNMVVYFNNDQFDNATNHLLKSLSITKKKHLFPFMSNHFSDIFLNYRSIHGLTSSVTKHRFSCDM